MRKQHSHSDVLLLFTVILELDLMNEYKGGNTEMKKEAENSRTSLQSVWR